MESTTESLEHSVSGVDSEFSFAVVDLVIPRSGGAKTARSPWTNAFSGWDYQGSYGTKNKYVIRSDLGKKLVHKGDCGCSLDQVVLEEQIVSTQMTHPAPINMTFLEAE